MSDHVRLHRRSPLWLPTTSKEGLRRALSAVVLVGCASFLVVPPSIRAQDASFWSFLETGRVVTRCRESSAGHQQGRARLVRLDERIQALKDADPVVSVVTELHGLLKTECFLAAAETERIPKPDTAVSLKEWWINGDGRGWLASFLELPRLGSIDSLAPHVVVPPDTRKTLDLDAHGDHPLRDLLCPLGDAACGAETRGWKVRAAAFLESHQEMNRSRISDERKPSGAKAIAEECTAKRSSGRRERYQQWRACIETRRPKRVALPLGEFKPLTKGWLVVTGRRGHYEFCDTTRAYHLADGAAFIFDSCSDLVLKRGGHVDFDATNKRRVERVAAGTISVENLREAVWMLLLRGVAEEVQLMAEYYPLPAGVTPRIAVRADGTDSFGGGAWFNTGQTSLTWRWTPGDGGAAFVGELTWPDSYDAAEGHAASLLSVAEQGFVEGCAAGPVPAPPVLTSGKDANLNEVSADAIRELDQEFTAAFERWKVLRACRSGR